jgi:hypothetical protein
MTVSGTTTFSVTCQELITDAFILAEIIADTDTLEATDYAVALRTLNKMCKSIQARNIGLWLNQEVFLCLEYQEPSYLLGTANCAATMVQTAIATAAVSGATSLDVDSITGISNGQYIGIQLDDLTMQWTTVNGVPAGTTIVLSAALTDSAAVANVVFTYTTKTGRPKEIIEARLRDKNGIDTPLSLMPVYSYRQTLSQKTTHGKPNQYAYDPQLANGVLYIWETAADVSDRIAMTIKREVYDFVAVGNTPDFPIEWSEALEAGLAARLAYKFPTTTQKKGELKVLEKERFDEVEGFDREPFIQFMPDYDTPNY